MKKNSLLLLVTFFLASCGNETFNTTDEMSEYINEEENEYKYLKKVNNVEYELVYMPTDLLVKQELGEDKNTNQIEKLRLKYNKYIYFNLSMSLNDRELLTNVAGNRFEFGRMANDLAFAMKEKVNLYTPNNDTLTMVDFIYPRMYGMSKATSIMLVYPRDKRYLEKEYINLTIEDLGFYTGDVKFKVKTKSILNEPQLRFD